MPTLQLRRFEQILERSIGRLVSRTALSDVSDTSIAKNLLAAVAREQDEGYFQMTRLRDLFDFRRASGEDLTERAQEIAPNTLTRLGMAFAIGNVQFGRAGTSGTVIVPSGTVVSTAAGVQFRTTRQGQITAGSTTSGDVPVIATVAGAAGNVAAGTVVRFAAKPPGIDTVNNAAGISQGRDLESDSAFRQRLLNYIASLSRCTPQALAFVAIGIQDPTNGRSVQYASVFEDPVDRGNVLLYIDDGAGTAAESGSVVSGEVVIASALGGEEFLNLANGSINMNAALTITSGGTGARGALTLGTDYFLNPASGRIYFTPALGTGESITATYTPYINLIPTVQRVIDGDPADRVNYPGYRAAGVLVRVLSPSVRSIEVEGVLSVQNVDRARAVADANTAVANYINNVGISGDIIRNEVIEAIMGVNGVTDVDLILPPSNITVLDDEIPRTSASLINLT